MINESSEVNVFNLVTHIDISPSFQFLNHEILKAFCASVSDGHFTELFVMELE